MRRVAWLAVLLALLAGPAWARSVTDLPCNARPDRSELDSTVAFQCAINLEASQGGGIVTVPHGRFWFRGNLSLLSGVALVGEGRGPYDPMISPIANRQGPTLLIRGNSFAKQKPFITIWGANSAVEDLIFAYPDQTPANDPQVGTVGPKQYQPTIQVRSPAKIRRNLFVNGWHDVEVLVGRVYLEGNHFGGLKYAVTVDNAWDIVRIADSVFEPFSDWGLPPPQNLDFWMRNNAIALWIKKADGLELSNLLIYGREQGILFDASEIVPDGAVSGVGSNINLDNVRYGVVMLASEERFGFTFINLSMGPVPEDSPTIPGGKKAVWLRCGYPDRQPRLSIIGGTIRHLWERDFQVDMCGGTPAGQLFKTRIIGDDLAPRL